MSCIKKKSQGGVDLLAYSESEVVLKNSELLKKILKVVDFGEMPQDEKRTHSNERRTNPGLGIEGNA